MAKEVDAESIRPTGTRPKVRFQNQKSSLDRCLTDATIKYNKKVTFNENPIILNALSKDHFISNHPESISTQVLGTKSAQATRTRKVQSTKTLSKPVVHSANTSKLVLQKPIVVTRTKLNPEDIKEKPPESSNVFVKPELHSSLWVAEKLKAIQLEDFNSNLSVANKLEACKATKQKIDRKASKQVNISPSEVVFHDITPLEFDQEALLTAAAEEKEAKLKVVLPLSRNRDPKPDIDEYLTEDMEPEFFTLPNPKVDFSQFRQPMKAPQSSVYNLYKHRRMWENLP